VQHHLAWLQPTNRHCMLTASLSRVSLMQVHANHAPCLEWAQWLYRKHRSAARHAAASACRSPKIDLCRSLRLWLLIFFGLICFGERGSNDEREGNGGLSVNLIDSQQRAL
jgi:hypothetical protein